MPAHMCYHFILLKAAYSAAECQHQSVAAVYMLALVSAGLLFQLPGLLLAGACGIGAANFLKNPAPWLRCVTSGGEIAHKPLPCLCNCAHSGSITEFNDLYLKDPNSFCNYLSLIDQSSFKKPLTD
jgi:hypothetical protein